MSKKDKSNDLLLSGETYRLLAQAQFYLSTTQAEIYLNHAIQLFEDGLKLDPSNRWGLAHLGTSQRMIAPIKSSETSKLYKKSVESLRTAVGIPSSDLDLPIPPHLPASEDHYPWGWAQLGQTYTWWGLYDLYNISTSDNQFAGYPILMKRFVNADQALDHALAENSDYALANSQKAILHLFWALCPNPTSAANSKAKAKHVADHLKIANDHILIANRQVKDWAWGLSWASAITHCQACFCKTMSDHAPGLSISIQSHNQIIAGILIDSNIMAESVLWSLIWPDQTGDPTSMIDIPLSRFLNAENKFYNRDFEQAFAIMDNIWEFVKR